MDVQSLKISQDDWNKISDEIIKNLSNEVHVWKLRRDQKGKIKTWELVYANPVALGSWGHTLEEIQGKVTEEIFVNSDPVNLFMPIVEKIFQDNAPFCWEEYFGATNQTLKMTSIPVGEFFISTGSDITPEKEADRFISQAHKLDSLGAIAGGVVHDVRNILTIIQSNAELLRDFDLGAPAEKRVSSILKSCDNASELLGQILNFGKSSEEITEINLNSKINNVINILRPSLKKNVEIRFEENPIVPLIKGNRIQLSQILFNIANNALRSMDEKGGTLTFSLSEVDKFARITLSDTGCGMDPQMLPHIFKPFYSRSKDGKGNGLGLSIVKSIVEKHNGYVTVESELGLGTVFHIHLPLSKT